METKLVGAGPALILALFVTPENRHRAIANLRRVLLGFDESSYELTVLDVAETQEVAAVAGIVATPTLVRYYPSPRLQIVGNLSDIQKVRNVLLERNYAQDEVFLVHGSAHEKNDHHEPMLPHSEQTEKVRQFVRQDDRVADPNLAEGR